MDEQEAHPYKLLPSLRIQNFGHYVLDKSHKYEYISNLQELKTA
jgi:hypothetical protein